MSNLSIIKFAFKDLRGGLSKFWIFFICLFFGVLTISSIGTFRESIKEGLQTEASEILGGDISLTLAYRGASSEELKEIKKFLLLSRRLLLSEAWFLQLIMVMNTTKP